MKFFNFHKYLACTIFLLTSSLISAKLNSWNEPYRSTIINYVTTITKNSSKNYIPKKFRIAVFDLDGTLIAEKPGPLEAALTSTRLLEKLKKNPALIEKPVYRAVKTKDKKFFKDPKNIQIKVTEAFSGEPLDFYLSYIKNFYKQHINKHFKKPYSQLLYTPMKELLNYLKNNDFSVYICSGTQEYLLRIIAADLNLAPQNMIGAKLATEIQYHNGKAKIILLNKILQPYPRSKGKPLSIFHTLKAQPIVAVGNSLYDTDMFKYTSSSPYKSLVLVIDHDNPKEILYPKKALTDIANKNNWQIISMKKAFKEIF